MSDITETALRNLALGKAATQSSISSWSIGRTAEADASIATNGDITSPHFFHTGYENSPWWEVDLGDYFIIDEVRIFNRQDDSERLRHFTVLVSQTRVPDSWVAICRKDDDAEFGRGNNIPFVLKPEIRAAARFVRIQMDGPGILHFRECQIMGHEPEADELTLLREQGERIIRRLADERAAIERDLAAGRKGYVTRIDSRAIFVDTENYSPTVVRALTSGDYEGTERRIVPTLIRPTDRVLEVGTAVGAVTMAVAAIVSPESVATYDANPAMVADARRNFAANRMSEIHAAVGVMRNRSRWMASEQEIEFFVSRDLWSSRLAATPGSVDITHVVKVPLDCLETKIAEHRANVLICDIEGGEADLLNGADLGAIRLIMMEIHYWAVGRQPIDDMVRYLISSGFNIDFNYCVVGGGGGVLVLDRAM